MKAREQALRRPSPERRKNVGNWATAVVAPLRNLHQVAGHSGETLGPTPKPLVRCPVAAHPSSAAAHQLDQRVLQLCRLKRISGEGAGAQSNTSSPPAPAIWMRRDFAPWHPPERMLRRRPRLMTGCQLEACLHATSTPPCGGRCLLRLLTAPPRGLPNPAQCVFSRFGKQAPDRGSEPTQLSGKTNRQRRFTQSGVGGRRKRLRTSPCIRVHRTSGCSPPPNPIH